MGNNRLSGVTSKGLEASLIGLTMAGCIGLGYLIGHWLDGKMGTTYWMPIMVILGIIAGARETWNTFVRIRESFSEDTFHDNKSNVAERRYSQNLDLSDASRQNRGATSPPDHRKPRSFHVPPPPVYGSDSEEEQESDNPLELEEGSLEQQLAKLRVLQQQIEQADVEVDKENDAHRTRHTKEHGSK